MREAFGGGHGMTSERVPGRSTGSLTLLLGTLSGQERLSYTLCSLGTVPAETPSTFAQ